MSHGGCKCRCISVKQNLKIKANVAVSEHSVCCCAVTIEILHFVGCFNTLLLMVLWQCTVHLSNITSTLKRKDKMTAHSVSTFECYNNYKATDTVHKWRQLHMTEKPQETSAIKTSQQTVTTIRDCSIQLGLLADSCTLVDILSKVTTSLEHPEMSGNLIVVMETDSQRTI